MKLMQLHHELYADFQVEHTTRYSHSMDHVLQNKKNNSK